MPTKNTILVTGDVFVDHHVYEGERLTVSATNHRGIQIIRQYGGAAGLSDLVGALLAGAVDASEQDKAQRVKAVGETAAKLAEVQKNKMDSAKISEAQQKCGHAKARLAEWQPREEANWVAHAALTMPALDSIPCGHHALAIWKPFPKEADEQCQEKVWRAGLLMGYGHDEVSVPVASAACPTHQPAPLNNLPTADILVLDDAGFAFRHRESQTCWLLPGRGKKTPAWIVLKMSGPVCAGDLWNLLAKEYAGRLVVIVSAHELRQECVRLGKGLSWEQTVEEMREALLGNPLLGPLATKPRHLIVTFSADGALWLDNSGAQPKATLVFDAGSVEGSWAKKIQGEAFGYLSCMTASVVRSLAVDVKNPLLAPAIASGLAAMRDLHKSGHGLAGNTKPAGFPVQRLANTILAAKNNFSPLRVPWTDDEWTTFTSNPSAGTTRRPWQIVESSQCAFGSHRLPSLIGLATQVVLQGESVIKRLPHARFGKLLTADRFEIEALHTIERQMEYYKNLKKAEKPLSLGVFGPPGAGKSFGVKQIANAIFGKEAWLEFNLSQFKDLDDLIGAFHQVRDKVLSGATPVVFWDEFDSREYFWLQYLLAPMQDGRFQEGQISHYIGKCVFIFAGATSYAFAEFGPDKKDGEKWSKFKLCKGPDFHSRLDAYFDVLGPNQRTLAQPGGKPGARLPDRRDVCTPLRRALLIRALLGVPQDARLDFDRGLLNALLAIPNYEHGARSLEKLVLSLRPKTNDGTIRRSSLPPAPVLAMHLGAESGKGSSFEDLLNKDSSFVNSNLIEAIARVMHEEWRDYAAKNNPLNRPWNQLTAEGKTDNYAAARRIPEVLAIAGLEIRPRGRKSARNKGDLVNEHIRNQLERLAEAEHDGWMMHRLKNGWRFDPVRDDKRKLHPLLKTYGELPELEKDKDRRTVLNYSKLLEKAGYHMAFIG